MRNIGWPLLAAALLAWSGAGCSTTIKQTDTELGADWVPMRPATRLFIAIPEDAIDKKEPVLTSGKRTAAAVQDAFGRHTRAITMARQTQSMGLNLADARRARADYLITSTILKWQDRPTEWTGVRDKLALRVEVYSTAEGALVRSTTIEGKSRFMSDGGDAPQDLLAGPLAKFAAAMFQITHAPSVLK